jgi:hypothetical protein
VIKQQLSPNHRFANVLSVLDLQALTRWCAARRLAWLPGRADFAENVILLEPIARSGFWQALTLYKQDQLYRLAGEWGEILAEGSGLHALLDAMDGGIACNTVPPQLPLAVPGPDPGPIRHGNRL